MNYKYVELKKIVVFIACAILLILSILSVYQSVQVVNTKQQITVVLDAGHGGIDSGVVGTNSGIKESDLNLIMVQVLAEKLEDANINVILTRKNKNGLYDAGKRKFKRQDFERRKIIIEDANPSLVISIHMNYYKSSSRRGSQVFYNGLNQYSKELGKIMQDTLNYNLNYPQVHRNYSALNGDFYIINCTPYPSIIIECGFLSNPEDERLLSTESYREKLSYYIFSGIMNYLTAY